MYELYNKAGDDYKIATYEYMEKLIKSEQVPTSFLDTYLTQSWKWKRSLDAIYSYEILEKQVIRSLSYRKHEKGYCQCLPKKSTGRYARSNEC